MRFVAHLRLSFDRSQVRPWRMRSIDNNALPEQRGSSWTIQRSTADAHVPVLRLVAFELGLVAIDLLRVFTQPRISITTVLLRSTTTGVYCKNSRETRSGQLTVMASHDCIVRRILIRHYTFVDFVHGTETNLPRHWTAIIVILIAIFSRAAFVLLFVML